VSNLSRDAQELLGVVPPPDGADTDEPKTPAEQKIEERLGAIDTTPPAWRREPPKPPTTVPAETFQTVEAKAVAAEARAAALQAAWEGQGGSIDAEGNPIPPMPGAIPGAGGPQGFGTGAPMVPPHQWEATQALAEQLNIEPALLVQALGEYAAVALENARLYSQVQSERRQLETILQQTEDGVLITDPQDRLLLINRTAQEAFGLNQDAALLHPLTEAVPHPELLALYARRDTPSPQLRRAEVTLADGRVFHTHLTPIEGVGHVVVMRDITHLKELDRIKSEFVTTVSHDLRSPLTTILGYVDLIERGGPLTPQQHEFLRRVQDSTQSITALITDLVHLGRIEAGLDTQQDLVDLSALAGYAADSLRLRSENKGIHLEVDLPPDLPAVAGNPVRLRQMINNLIDNAIKFTPENGRVTVSTHLEENQVLLLVSDTGVGIPTPEQPYIFNKFYRASNVEDGTGSGLGLSIVKSIVEVHGGRIWVESTVGEGSTFTVVLPTAQAKQDEPPEVSASGG